MAKRTLKDQLCEWWKTQNTNMLTNYGIIGKFIAHFKYDLAVKTDFSEPPYFRSYSSPAYQKKLMPIICILPAHSQLCKDFLNYMTLNHSFTSTHMMFFNIHTHISRICDKLSNQKYGTLWVHN